MAIECTVSDCRLGPIDRIKNVILIVRADKYGLDSVGRHMLTQCSRIYWMGSSYLDNCRNLGLGLQSSTFGGFLDFDKISR